MTDKTDIDELVKRMHEHADEIIEMEQDFNEDGYHRKELIELYDKADSLFSAQNIKLLINALEAERHRADYFQKSNNEYIEHNGKLSYGIKAAQQRIAELESKQQWISVKDRLPAFNIDVQIYCKDGGEQMVGYRISDNDFSYASDEDGRMIVCEPSHWMPIPPAPEFDDGNN